MINWDEELEKIFADPLLADVTAPKRKINSSDRLIAGFQQIIEFVETHNRLPQISNDREERRLYNHLQGIVNDPEKKKRCKPYDVAKILESGNDQDISKHDYNSEDRCEVEMELLETIFNDPILNNGNNSEDGLFDIPDYMKQRIKERQEADYVAKKVKCEDFNFFEAGFKEVHQGLKSGKYRLVKFKEAHIGQGRYFLEDGVLVYIASLERKEKNRHGRNDSRTRCIYENGMESGIYMQTLCKNLYSSGYSIQDMSSIDDDYLKKKFSIDGNDVESGLIYVLRSLSKDPEIMAIPNLYKIGFTTIPLEARIANAKNEPTYLCSEVEVIATCRVYNVKSSTFEALIHKLFSDVRLQVSINGKTPKEWFIVPLPVIEQAITYIINGQPIAYDKEIQQIICIDE